MRIALTAGGTGGHIFPALAVLDALQARPGVLSDVRFFGPQDRGERTMVEGRGVRFEAIPAAAIRGRNPLQLLASVARIGWGTVVAVKKLAAFRPSVVFSTGGYASFPCSLAARVLRRKLVVYLPDVAPGWAVRAEMKLATRLATTTEAALDHLPRNKTTVTGYPVRPAFFGQAREDARAALGIAPGELLLLVGTSSQGSQAINAATFGAIEALTGAARVIHIVGRADLEHAQAFASARYEPGAFRDDLPTVMLAADLAVARAGASTLGELTAAGLPAILVPGTYAGGHQRDNARWLANAGAAVIVEEANLAELAGTVVSLIGDPARLAMMRTAASELARPGAADAIADLIVEVAAR